MALEKSPLANLANKLSMYHELLSSITPGVKPYSKTQRISLFFFQVTRPR